MCYNNCRGVMIMNKRQSKALEQAIASVEMEGFKFTDEKKKLCEALVDGDMSFDKFLKDLKEGKLSVRRGS